MMTYLNKEHEERYKILIEKSRLNYEDREREALFYLLAGNSDLYKQVDKIYNFKKQQLNCMKDEQVDLTNIYTSSSSRALILSGIELFNSGAGISVTDVFKYLDKQNSILVLESIRIRYNL